MKCIGTEQRACVASSIALLLANVLACGLVEPEPPGRGQAAAGNPFRGDGATVDAERTTIADSGVGKHDATMNDAGSRADGGSGRDAHAPDVDGGVAEVGPRVDSGADVVTSFGDGGPSECVTPDDCESLLGPVGGWCDGSCSSDTDAGCLHYVCLAGICQSTSCASQPESFSGAECMTPMDCESLLGAPPGFCSAACPNAPDHGCLHYLCLSGVCRQSFCEDQPASFAGSECATPADCESLLGPLADVCVLTCPGSPNGGCMHYLCLAGICQTSYCK